MNYGEIKKCDIANGEGVRVALFVSGCRHHCKGCFNSMTWDFNYGKKFTEETEEEILEVYEVLKKNQYGQYLKDVLDGKYRENLY